MNSIRLVLRRNLALEGALAQMKWQQEEEAERGEGEEGERLPLDLKDRTRLAERLELLAEMYRRADAGGRRTDIQRLAGTGVNRIYQQWQASFRQSAFQKQVGDVTVTRGLGALVDTPSSTQQHQGSSLRESESLPTLGRFQEGDVRSYARQSSSNNRYSGSNSRRIRHKNRAAKLAAAEERAARKGVP